MKTDSVLVIGGILGALYLMNKSGGTTPGLERFSGGGTNFSLDLSGLISGLSLGGVPSNGGIVEKIKENIPGAGGDNASIFDPLKYIEGFLKPFTDGLKLATDAAQKAAQDAQAAAQKAALDAAGLGALDAFRKSYQGMLDGLLPKINIGGGNTGGAAGAGSKNIIDQITEMLPEIGNTALKIGGGAAIPAVAYGAAKLATETAPAWRGGAMFTGEIFKSWASKIAAGSRNLPKGGGMERGSVPIGGIAGIGGAILVGILSQIPVSDKAVRNNPLNNLFGLWHDPNEAALNAQDYRATLNNDPFVNAYRKAYNAADYRLTLDNDPYINAYRKSYSDPIIEPAGLGANYSGPTPGNRPALSGSGGSGGLDARAQYMQTLNANPVYDAYKKAYGLN
jgi:hypothetical protein